MTRLRCAIYTRKSTNEGLDRAFNSLDAQREACEAFIVSQKSEGWTCVRTRYDDGGYSGGNTERPALQALLADVKRGAIDVVVVYKVDRLSRSLSDFAKIVDVLDAHSASFVSVTQAFNTTNSMGRLTLNVLLSFAQFEREVIAERVRDKIAASKAKGMWMGGPVPLGYDVKERKLIANTTEATTVRDIYRRYLAARSVFDLMQELAADGVVTKRRALRDGTSVGGIAFARGSLFHLLKNPMYIGKLRHLDKVHEGEHEAIVDRDLWDQVQAKLAAGIGNRRAGPAAKHPSLLVGRVRDDHGRPMSPSHAVKKGRRYRYYVSNVAVPGENDTGGNSADISCTVRLPAPPLERAVLNAVADILDNRTQIAKVASGATSDARTLRDILIRASDLRQALQTGNVAAKAILIAKLDLALIVSVTGIAGSIGRAHLLALLEDRRFASDGEQGRIALSLPTQQVRHGKTVKLVLRTTAKAQRESDPRLVALIAKAERAKRALFDHKDEAAMHDRQTIRVARIVYLAPDIVVAILDGRQPEQLTARRLLRMPALPLAWDEQRVMLGFV